MLLPQAVQGCNIKVPWGTSLMLPLQLPWPLLLGNYPVKIISWRNGLVVVLNHDLRQGEILFNTSHRLLVHVFFQFSKNKDRYRERDRERKFCNSRGQLAMAVIRDFLRHDFENVLHFSTANLNIMQKTKRPLFDVIPISRM